MLDNDFTLLLLFGFPAFADCTSTIFWLTSLSHVPLRGLLLPLASYEHTRTNTYGKKGIVLVKCPLQLLFNYTLYSEEIKIFSTSSLIGANFT